jgi:hypothetical protein
MRIARERLLGESYRQPIKLTSILDQRPEKRKVKLSVMNSLTAWEDIKRMVS